MRSQQSYALLVASAMHFRLTGFVACSGAKTSDVLAKQIGAVTSKTNVVTISVGGDDAGFATIVWNCLVERWKRLGGAQERDLPPQQRRPPRLCAAGRGRPRVAAGLPITEGVALTLDGGDVIRT